MEKMVCRNCKSTVFARTESGYTCKGCGMEYGNRVAQLLIEEVDEENLNISNGVSSEQGEDLDSINKTMHRDEFTKRQQKAELFDKLGTILPIVGGLLILVTFICIFICFNRETFTLFIPAAISLVLGIVCIIAGKKLENLSITVKKK